MKKYIFYIIVFISLKTFAQTNYQYDNLNRLIQVEYNDGTIESYNYDAEGNRLSHNITVGTATVDLSFVSQAIAGNNFSAGATSTLSFTLENTGNSAATNQKTYFYLSTDSNYDVSDIEIGCQYVSGIANMSSSSHTTNITIPANTSSGSYYLVLVTDGDNVVTETDENNNEVSIPITVSGSSLSNLVVQNATVSNTTIMIGGSEIISYTIANIQSTASSNSTFKCYLSTDLSYDPSDVELLSTASNISGLAGNTSSNHTGTFTIPNGTSTGNYFLIFYADANNTENETDETDNTQSVAITVISNSTNSPVANFSAATTDICIGQSIQFTDLSTNAPSSWSWTFTGGSPSSSNNQNPTIVYNVAGTYAVSLTVSNGTGTDNETKTGYITVGSGGSSGAAASWVWADQFNESGSASAIFSDIYTTSNDETYVLGHFRGTITIGGQSITSQGPNIYDLFIAKFNSNGSLAWMQRHGTPDREETYPGEIYVDSDGYIYITGQFYVQINIGGTTLNGYHQPSAGQGGARPDFYVAKLDPTGTTTSASNTWLVHGENLSGTNNTDAGVRLQVYQNEVFVVGRFDGSTRFGSTTLSMTGGNDIFLTALDKTSGNFNWAKKIGGTDFDWILGFDIDAFGKIYMSGYYRSDMSFDGTSTTLSANGSPEVGYIVQYDAATGSFGWARDVNNGSQVQLWEVYSSGVGVYLSGSMLENNLNFAGSTIIHNGYKDAIVLKYDSNGNEVWGKGYGNIGTDDGNDITGDGTSIFVAGNHYGSVDFGSLSVSPTGTNTNLFILGLDGSGNELWVESIEATGNVFGQKLDLTSNGNVVVGGTGVGGITFGGITTTGTYAPYIAEYMPSNGVACSTYTNTITANGSTTICSGGSIQLTAESGYTYNWSTGETTQAIQVSQAGVYEVTVTDCNECTSVSNSITISISDDSTPSSISTTDENCSNSDGQITMIMSNTQAVTVAWNGGMLTHAANDNILQIDGLSAGSYSVTLTDVVGCTAVENVSLNNTGSNPASSFTYTINNSSVDLVNTSTNGTTYSWDFGDGTTSTNTNSSHNYSTYGNYNVCLTTTNSCGNDVYCESVETFSCTIVTNTNDSGPGSLREAMICANDNPGTDVITFQIPGIGPHIIYVNSQLPNLTDGGTIIDASTQPNFNIGTIVLDGINAGVNDEGIVLLGNDCELYGMTIKNFQKSGIWAAGDNFIIGDDTKGNTIYNCLFGIFVNQANNGIIKNNNFGVDEMATISKGMTAHCIRTRGVDGILIDNNTISASGAAGIGIGDYGYTDSNYQILNNNIGTDPSGALNFGNTNSGIDKQPTVSVTNMFIYNNKIANNGIYGVWAYDSPSTEWHISENAIYCNQSGGIAVTNGANNNVDIPIINTANLNGISGTAQVGNLIEVFTTDDTDCPNSPCQGRHLLGTTIADASGNWSLLGNFSSGVEITATATAVDNTSEFSLCTTIEASCEIPVPTTVTIISGNVVKLNWNAVISAERYRIRYRELGGSWTEKLTAVDETFRFLNDLQLNTTYQYQLKSLCAASNSVWSPTYTFTTSSEICDLPLSTNVNTLSSTEATISWSAHTDDLKYKMKYKLSSNTTPWTEYTSLSLNSKTETGLIAGQEYKYKIKTKCTGGWTAWSGNYYFTMPNSFATPRVDNNQDLNFSNVMKLFPNPTKEKLTVTFTSEQIRTIRILDINGRVLQELNTNELEIELSVNNLQSGIYYLNVFSEDKTMETARFVKL